MIKPSLASYRVLIRKQAGSPLYCQKGRVRCWSPRKRVSELLSLSSSLIADCTGVDPLYLFYYRFWQLRDSEHLLLLWMPNASYGFCVETCKVAEPTTIFVEGLLLTARVRTEIFKPSGMFRSFNPRGLALLPRAASVQSSCP